MVNASQLNIIDLSVTKKMIKMDEIKEAIYKIEEDLDSEDSDLDRETKVLKERTKHSIRLMKNEFMKKVQFPYLVRAL